MEATSPNFPSRLEMRGISKRFGATVALENVDLEVAPGEVLALVGENGAGKSTLMKVLSGAHRPDCGEMRLDQQVFAPRDPLEARRAGVAMIYQELSLAPHLTVEENILLGMEPATRGWIDRRAVRRRALEALSHFSHPDIRPELKVARLSPAAQQLVEIARALAVGCRVLVLDEPTSSLSGRDVERLFELIAQLKGQGISTIYISHVLEEVRRVADRVVVLRDGRTVGGGRTSEMTASGIVTQMVGREVRDLYPVSRRTPGEPLLELDELAGLKKPASASLTLRRGEVFGIAGLMGAGRTELLRCIFGLDAVRQGRIRIGTFAGPSSPSTRWQQGAGLLSEDRKQEGLALSMTIADNVTLSKLGVFGSAGWIWPGRQRVAARRWVGELGIRCRDVGQAVQDLSGGNQQKVAFARLLQHDVDLLLLDEPTRGIDVAAKATIYRLINELAAGGSGRAPKAVLMVSSYLPELMGLCDRIAVMCRGRLGPAHPVGEVSEHALMVEATGQED